MRLCNRFTTTTTTTATATADTIRTRFVPRHTGTHHARRQHGRVASLPVSAHIIPTAAVQQRSRPPRDIHIDYRRHRFAILQNAAARLITHINSDCARVRRVRCVRPHRLIRRRRRRGKIFRRGARETGGELIN